MASPLDRVTVEAFGTPSAGLGVIDFNFEDFTSFALQNSIINPSEASFELGDDSGFDRMNDLVGLGAEFRVFINDRLRLTGRVEQLNSATDASKSTTQRFVVRTKLSDAIYASAPQNVRMKNVSIKDFVVALYADIGLSAADFDFQGDVSRDLMTGARTKNGRPPRPLEPLKVEEAKVQPPESIFAAAERHLRRHGFMQWDGPDGKIVIAAPDDEQATTTVLWCLRGEDSEHNNVLSIERDQDVSGSPTVLGMFGSGGQVSATRSKVSAIVRNPDLIRRGFRRKVTILDEAMRNKELANRRAARELSQRNRGLDRVIATVDGFSFRGHPDLPPWTPDTTSDIIAEQLGGALGRYYLEEVVMSRSASGGDITRLSLVPKGVWQI